jgi:hypothetical protein
MVTRFGNTTKPYVTFGLHMGYTIEGAIGSDFKIERMLSLGQRADCIPISAAM